MRVCVRCAMVTSNFLCMRRAMQLRQNQSSSTLNFLNYLLFSCVFESVLCVGAPMRSLSKEIVNNRKGEDIASNGNYDLATTSAWLRALRRYLAVCIGTPFAISRV